MPSRRSFARSRTTARLLRVLGSNGSIEDVPCESQGGVAIHVTLSRPIVLKRGVAYSLILVRDDGTPVKGVSPLRIDSGLLRPVSLTAVDLLADDPPRDVGTAPL